jgi:hypothetical protein
MDQERLRERLEASQADAVDLGLTEVEALELRELLADDPRLAAELDRIHAWDAKIGEVFDDAQIPVPEGLASRLKTAVAVELDSPSPNPDTRHSNSRRLSRRAVIATALAASLLLLVSGWIVGVLTREQPLIGDELLSAAESLTNESQEFGADWQTGPVPNSVSPELRPKLVKRWGKLTFAGRQAEVFDLVRVGAPRALLIAIPATKSDLGRSPAPMPGTGGYTIGMWQETTHAYVLVVRGDESRYRLFLKEAGQLTMLR